MFRREGGYSLVTLEGERRALVHEKVLSKRSVASAGKACSAPTVWEPRTRVSGCMRGQLPSDSVPGGPGSCVPCGVSHEDTSTTPRIKWRAYRRLRTHGAALVTLEGKEVTPL